MRVVQLISWEGDTPVWVADPLDYNPWASVNYLLNFFGLAADRPVSSNDSGEFDLPLQCSGKIVHAKIRVLGLKTSRENPLKGYFGYTFYAPFEIEPTDIGFDEDLWSDERHDKEISAEIERETLESISRRIILFRGSVFVANRVPLNKEEQATLFLLAEDQLNKKEIELLKLSRRVERQRKRLVLGSSINQQNRKNIPNHLSSFILDRDKVCQECGSMEDLELDHIIPVSRGGSNSEKNLKVLCGTCNRRRGDLTNY